MSLGFLVQLRKWLSGRASPCQGEGREFESRFPLHEDYAQQILLGLFCIHLCLADNYGMMGCMAYWVLLIRNAVTAIHS